MGLSHHVLAYVINTRGQGYKQPSPEQREEFRVHDRNRRDRLRRAYLL